MVSLCSRMGYAPPIRLSPIDGLEVTMALNVRSLRASLVLTFHAFLLSEAISSVVEAASIPTSNEYHEGVEACYRLAGEAKTETDRLA